METGYILGLLIGVVAAICFRDRIRRGIRTLIRRLRNYFDPPL